MGNRRTESQVTECFATRAQADFNVRQTFAQGDLGKAHGQELIPAREVADFVVAAIASHAAAELLGVNPLHELRENGFSEMHAGIWASKIPRKSTEKHAATFKSLTRASPQTSLPDKKFHREPSTSTGWV